MKIRIFTIFTIVVLSFATYVIINFSQRCKVDSILLEKRDFPPNTIMNEVQSPIAEMPNESAGFTASYGESLMYYEVSRFPWVFSAENEFLSGKKSATGQTEYHGPWEKPPFSIKSNSIFTNYYVACGNVFNMGYQCRMMGQYSEYYVFFFAYISDKGVTFDIFDDLIQKIDLRMRQCVQK